MQIKRLAAALAVPALATTLLLTASPAAAAPAPAGPVISYSHAYVSGVRVGNVVTYTNTTNEPLNGFLDNYYTGGKRATFVASANAVSFLSSTHSTYTRVLKRMGVRYIWVNVYLFDGYNLWLTVPANSTVTVTGTLI